MNNVINFDNNLLLLNENDLNEINGGVITLTICGVVFVGWKAVALIAAGITTLGGAAALLGAWNGYWDTRN